MAGNYFEALQLQRAIGKINNTLRVVAAFGISSFFYSQLNRYKLKPD